MLKRLNEQIIGYSSKKNNKLQRFLLGWCGSSLLQQPFFAEFCQLIPTPFYANHASQMEHVLMQQHRQNLLF